MSRRNHRTSSFKNLIVSLLFLIILGIIGYFVYPIVVELLHEHGFIEGKCECGELDPNYVPPHIHEYIDGVCSCGKLDESTSVIQSDTLSIHFMELGNKYTGDSIYIKAGETDILIDAGSRGNSADDITNYLNQYVEDNTLEYVIATHAHQDHIAGFVGTSQIKGIFDEFILEIDLSLVLLLLFPTTSFSNMLLFYI